jgi:hypothetical protein
MLSMALEEDDDDTYEPVSDLVDRAVACRARLALGGDAATRLARSLAYDITLIRLCERLELDHEMLGPRAGQVARQETERELAGRLPNLAADLDGA